MSRSGLSLPTDSSPAWFGAFAEPATEFGPVSLEIVSGAIPEALQGSLYLNGTGRLRRGDQQVAHWFDGDGAILAIHLGEQIATGIYRYVKTDGYLAEEASGKYTFAGYGMGNTGPIWKRFQKLKNAANTSVLALPDRLLALWEGGLPHALNLETLETLGLDSLGQLATTASFSAHPKRDRKTGDIYNFGPNLGPKNILHLYRSDRSGRILQTGTIPIPHKALVHDFVITDQYLVFVLPPVTLNLLPIILRYRSYCDSLVWQPQRGTTILVVDRDTFKLVSRAETSPWFQWHFANGFEDEDGWLSFDFVRYDDFQTNQFLKEVPSGNVSTYTEGTFWRVTMEGQTGKIIETYPLCDRPCEFPSVAPQDMGRSQAFTYLAVQPRSRSSHGQLLQGIARYDHQQDYLAEHLFPPNWYPSEPIFAQHPIDPDRGWVLTVMFDGDRHVSECWIFESDRLEDEPVCRLALPSVIPIGFHGTWNPHNGIA